MVTPNVLGMLLLLFAVLAGLMMVASPVKNTADAGDIALGVICHVLLAGGLVVVAIMAFQVPSKAPAGDAYQTYLWLITLLFTATALADAWVVSICRGYHGAIGWLLVPLNASWGLIGNLLGLMNHIACTFYFNNSGDEIDTRAFFVRYKSGFSLRQNFDYTQGDAMSANSVPNHEAVHVIQHFLFGPVYPLSYGLWAAIMFLPGIIVGIATRDPATNRGVGEGINDLCYYNCPWEQTAYQFEGGYGSDVVIFNKYVGWPVYIAWIIGATLLMVLFIVSRT